MAVEIAKKLAAPLVAMPVEEIASPGSPEYIVGAVSENALHVLDSDALAALGVTENCLAIRVAEATARIARLMELYRGEEQAEVNLAGRPVVLVDDGSASAPALEAVALALARHHVASICLVSPLPPSAEILGIERVIGVATDDEHAHEIALVGSWFDDPRAPGDEDAAAIVKAFTNTLQDDQSLADRR